MGNKFYITLDVVSTKLSGDSVEEVLCKSYETRCTSTEFVRVRCLRTINELPRDWSAATCSGRSGGGLQHGGHGVTRTLWLCRTCPGYGVT